MHVGEGGSADGTGVQATVGYDEHSNRELYSKGNEEKNEKMKGCV